jgi:hypothetical protein
MPFPHSIPLFFHEVSFILVDLAKIDRTFPLKTCTISWAVPGKQFSRGILCRR